MKKTIIAVLMTVGVGLTASAGQCIWGYWGAAVDHTGADFTGGTALIFTLTGADKAPTFNGTSWEMNGAVLLATSAYDSNFLGWGVGDYVEYAGVTPGTTAGAEQQYFSIVLTETAGVTDLSSYEGYYAQALTGQGVQMVVDPTAPTYGTEFQTFDTTITASSWQQATAVPEPTSGLLLLLGVAGLALKRKRA